jgi:hypothetical protein
MLSTLLDEIAASAARLVVDEGMEYAAAKRKAQRALGRHGQGRGELPANEQVEDEVREYLAIFCADTQPAELLVLRRLALVWLARLAEFRPHLAGAAWRGTATRLSALHLDLYCDDTTRCPEFGEPVTLFLSILDHDDLRGALKPDARGRSWRGDITALQRLLGDDPSGQASDNASHNTSDNATKHPPDHGAAA